MLIHSMALITNFSILKNNEVYLDILSGMPKHLKFLKPHAEILLKFIQGQKQYTFGTEKIYLMYNLFA